MRKFSRAFAAATVLTLSMFGAAGPAQALGMGDVVVIKSADGSVVMCTPFGCVQTSPPCQCSPKDFGRVATPPKTSGTAPVKLGR
jgi:hypothetical protein